MNAHGLERDPRCDDERWIRALHEAAHAVVALLTGVDFEDVTLPAPEDLRTGLRFEQIRPDGEPDRVVWLQVERQITMRLAGEAIEELLCGEIRFAGADIVDAMSDASSLTGDAQEQHDVRKLSKARARALVRMATPNIERVANRLLDEGTLSWDVVAELVLTDDETPD